MQTKNLFRQIVLFIFLPGVILAGSIFWAIHEPQKSVNTANPGDINQKQASVTPNDWMSLQRLYPYNRIKPEVYHDALEQAQVLMRQGSFGDESWELTGPTNIGGRITDIEIPEGDLNTIYVGAATGGIWKTTNGGLDWINLFQEVPVITIGDIAIDPDNSDILYAGTGEANSSSFSFWGNGIYKSMDGGLTWEHKGLDNSAYIGRVLVDHGNSDRIFVAACGYLFSYNDERGVYRSDDGGDTWDRVLYLTDSTAAIDLVQHPTNPNILYAAMWERTRGLEYRNSFGQTSGIWRTIDGGNTWEELTNGLLTGDVGRIGLTISQSNPNILYAFYDLPDFEVGVFKTADGGDSWVRTNDTELYGMNSNFGWYFGQIRVHPTNPDLVFVMGVSLYRTTNGGNTWSDQPSGGIHVDHHAMVIDETTGKIIEGNDGGLYTTINNGNSWTKINNLPITQFYAIDIDNLEPGRIYGGTQDNNTIRTLTGNIDDWHAVLGGDGMFTLVDYTNSDIFYAEYQWGNLFRSTNGWDMDYIAEAWEGDRVNWSAPLAMHPVDPQILYFGTYRVYKTTNRGTSWQIISDDLTQGIDQYFHTITTIAISKVDPAIIVVGTGDGKVQVSENNGDTWTDISAGLPERWVTRVVTDPFDSQSIYVTLSGFRWDEPLPHVWKSTDLGQTWSDVTGNLPEFPVNDLVIDPDYPGHLIAGTDAGVYGSLDDGDTWEWIWGDIPAVPIYMMKIHESTRKIVVGTYGLSTYSANLDAILSVNPKPVADQSGTIMITPNPGSLYSTIHYTLPQTTQLTCRLANLQGKVVFQGMLPASLSQKGSHRIPLSQLTGHTNTGIHNLPAGTYLLQLKGKGINLTGKLVVVND